jgi:hypothetical protein
VVLHYYLFYCNVTYKTETGIANKWQLLIANHLDQSLCLANKQQGAANRSYLLHSSLAGAQLCCAFHQPQQTEQRSRSKIYFPEPNKHILTFLHLIVMCRVTYPAPYGDALATYDLA